MKKLSIAIAITCMCLVLKAQYNSSDGDGIQPTGTYRTLNIFINIIYDKTPASNPFPNNDVAWPYTNIEGVTTTGPTYFTDYIDVNYTTPSNVHGTESRLFHESSFGRLIILGDMMVVNIKQSTIDPAGGSFSAGELITGCLNMINTLGVNTTFGHNSLADYDSNSDTEVDFVQYFCRNGTSTFGEYTYDTGFSSSGGQIAFNGIPHTINIYSYQQVDVGDISKRYKHISIHEFAHNLFGDNSFHTSGGNHYKTYQTTTFMGLQGGWGLMGAASSSLVSCNAFERWRLNWTSATYNSSGIRIQANGVNADIEKASGAKTFYLRDFVSTGDAIRIKLPYKENTGSSNQYIWLENHQINSNSKLDFFQYTVGNTCIPDGTPGIYAYYQVGKDVLSGSLKSDVWPSNETDNLKVISAEGNWDMIQDGTQNDCLNWANRKVLKQTSENPLLGNNDQMQTFYNPTASSLIGYEHDDIFSYVKKYSNGTINTSLPNLGDNLDAFTNNTKIGIATNPSSANTLTYYVTQSNGNILPQTTTRNNRKIFLNGLQISFTLNGSDQFGSIYKVDIYWDKYNVDKNVRWTGDIVLNETSILKSGFSMILNQNRTPNLKTRVAATSEFSNATIFTCENNSHFTLEANSTVTLDENSTFTLKSGSTLEINDGAKFIVKNGSKLNVESGATILIKGSGGIIMKCTGTLCVNSGATLNLQDFPSCIHLLEAGSLNSACLTNLSSVKTGNGSVKSYTSNLTLSGSTISSDSYNSGISITSSNVTIQGTGTDVIYEATNDITINGTFEVPIGATFEAKICSASCTN